MNKESILDTKIGFHAKNNQMNRTSKYSMFKSPTHPIHFLKSMNMGWEKNKKTINQQYLINYLCFFNHFSFSYQHPPKLGWSMEGMA
jgi:hypothetical protein